MRFNETDTRFDQYFYAGSFYSIRFLAKIAVGLKTTGSEHVPDEGPGLVASNHRHWMDILALPIAVEKRHISVLARDELYENRAASFLFRHWEAVPIKRGAHSKENYISVRRPLLEGRLVGLFPETTRGNKAMRRADPSANLGVMDPGVAGLAHRFNASTIPAAISGLDHTFTREHRHKVNGRVALGEPMEPPQKNDQSKKIFMAELRNRIEQLYDQTLEM